MGMYNYSKIDITKFAVLKCTIQGHSVHLQCGITITTIHFQNFCHPKQKLYSNGF